MCIDYLTNSGKIIDQFPVIHAHTNQHFDFLTYQIEQDTVIISFIRTSGNPNHRSSHTIQGIPGRIDIGGFRVVDISPPLHNPYGFEPMFHLREGPQSFSDFFVRNTDLHTSQNRSHRIIDIVSPLNTDLLFGDPELPVFQLHDHLFSFHPGTASTCIFLPYTPVSINKSGHPGYNSHLPESMPYRLAIQTVNKQILRTHIIQYPELRIDIIFEFMVVPIQMIRGYIRQNGNIRPEIKHPVELKTRKLDDIQRMCILCHLCSQTTPHISG